MSRVSSRQNLHSLLPRNNCEICTVPITFNCHREFDCLPSDDEQVSFKGGSKVPGTATLSNGTASFTTSTLTIKTHYTSPQTTRGCQLFSEQVCTAAAGREPITSNRQVGQSPDWPLAKPFP